jgi:hypothetical protein
MQNDSKAVAEIDKRVKPLREEKRLESWFDDRVLE